MSDSGFEVLGAHSNDDASSADVAFVVNGQDVVARVEVRWTLADLLRDRLGLRGTRLGCEHGVCGACTVLLDDQPVRSCLVLAVQVDGHQVETVEGLLTAEPSRLQRSFSDNYALQCGFCTSGFMVLFEAMARAGTSPETAETELGSNICRCTGYSGLRRALAQFLEERTP